MGTRHFIGVLSDGKYKIANYGQFDGYIEGQGAQIIEFLAKADLNKFRNKLNNCYFINDEELRQFYVNAGDAPENKSGFIKYEVAEKFRKMYPSLTRETGAQILDIVYHSIDKVPLYNREDFLEDEMWCEFGYVIDLDRETLHCYASGKDLFAEYILEDLPTVEEMKYDYEQWHKKNCGDTEDE